MKKRTFNKMLKTALTLSVFVTPTAFASELIVHEWGTFTSVVNKDGKMIQGLHHEEEALPNFVYDLSRIERTATVKDRIVINTSMIRNKGGGGPITRGFTPASMDLMPIPTFTERITQKMETPVIYFYSNKEMDVSVRVDFPKGVISQWFPNVSSVNPSEEAKNGYGVWDVKILNKKTAVLAATSGNSIWNPSRETNANILKVDNELEKLIFYRGLGDFDTPLSIVENRGHITVKNNSNQDIKGITLLNHRVGKNEYAHIDLLKANSEFTFIRFSDRKNNHVQRFATYKDYLASAQKTIVKDLVASGLYSDESQAMVNTWKGGYFQTEGLRLLYVLPIEWTEELLPIKMKPTPKELVRTLVGRVEILTGEDDKKILEFVNTKVKNNEVSPFDVNGRKMNGLGHFPEPKLRRALELNISEELKVKVNRLITDMNTGFLN